MVTILDMGRALVVAVALERVAELLVARRNARRLLAAGAVEAGRGHYPAMVGFHAALLVACAAEPALRPGPWPAPVAIPAAVAVLLAEGLRWWAVASLGGRWTTRVLVLPGAPPVRAGPYRWLRHPNYLAVIVEVAALPLAAGAWRTAVVASLVNAILLTVRIRVEERAMGRGWEAVFAGVPRFLPSPNPNLNPTPVPEARVPSPLARGPSSDAVGTGARGLGTGDRGHGSGGTGSGAGSGAGSEQAGRS